MNRVNTKNPTARYRPGIHVHVYFWAALVTVSVVPPLIVSSELFDADHATAGLGAFLTIVITLQGLLWRARRRFSTEALGVWDGWLYVTGSMTIGVGWISFLVAVPTTAVAILATAGLALLDLFEGDPATVQRRFHRMVSWFVRHRMHQ